MHLIVDILRNSILITGLVIVMMMMIESLNIESRGLFFKGLKKTKVGQVVIGALLGSVPGCMGGFATVSLYTHKMFSFGALVAMMIASSGDEAFVMLAMIPDKALLIFAILFIVAIAVGIITDLIHERLHRKHCHETDHSNCGVETGCKDGYEVHSLSGECEDGVKATDCHNETSFHTSHDRSGKTRHYGWKRLTMFVGLAIFIAALATGHLGHDHSAHGGHSHEGNSHCCECETVVHDHSGHATCTHEHPSSHPEHSKCHPEHQVSHPEHSTCHPEHQASHPERSEGSHSINLLDEEWMNILFAGLSILVLFVLLFGSDHFIEEHLWNHIIRKHFLTIFLWTFGVLLVVGIGLQYVSIDKWISSNTALMIILATLIGIIPESGPHMIFVTLYAAGVVPLPVLLASSISQDGHASLPLIAESRKSFLWAKLINCITALTVGFAAMLI